MQKAVNIDPNYSEPKKYLFTFNPVGGEDKDKYKKSVLLQMELDFWLRDLEIKSKPERKSNEQQETYL
jgi:hypothetical protein